MPTLTLNEKTIHYTDFKPESGVVRQTFIFIHGLGSSQNYYFPLISELLKDGLRCIIYDSICAARSSYTEVEQSVHSLSDDTIGILGALEVDKAVVVGHSMGGIVAAHLAATRSDRVLASVWIGPVYPSKNLAGVFDARIKLVEADGMEPLANSIPQNAVGSKANNLVKAMIRELLMGQNPQGYISNCKVIANAEPPAYAKVIIPVLVIAGEEDKTASLDSIRRMFLEVETEEKTLVVLPGVGHWHCLEAPEAVCKHILEFYHKIQ